MGVVATWLAAWGEVVTDSGFRGVCTAARAGCRPKDCAMEWGLWPLFTVAGVGLETMVTGCAAEREL